MFLESVDVDKLLSISELATKFNVWATHLSWGGSSYSNCVKSSSLLTSSSKQSWTFSKVTYSSVTQSSSIAGNEESVELCAKLGSENVVNAFTKLDLLLVTTVAVTFRVRP